MQRQKTIHTMEELYRVLDNPEGAQYIKLSGVFILQDEALSRLIINRPDLTIDGYDARFEVYLSTLSMDKVSTGAFGFLRIGVQGRNTVLRGLTVDILYNGLSFGRLCAVDNRAQSITVEDCRIVMHSVHPIDMVGIHNHGPNAVCAYKVNPIKIINNYIRLTTHSDLNGPSTLCGICNQQANAVHITGNDVFVRSNIPGGQVLGLYSNGWILRACKNTLTITLAHDIGFSAGVAYQGDMLFTQNNLQVAGGNRCYSYVCSGKGHVKTAHNQMKSLFINT